MAYIMQLYKDLLASGANITVYSDMFIPVVLKDLATIAKNNNALLTIREAHKLTPSILKELAQIGQRYINLEFER